MMPDNLKISANKQSVANNGNNNAVANGPNALAIINNFNGAVGLPRRAAIFEVCKIISEANIDFSEEYSISKNPDWNVKIKFNNVVEFVDIFDFYASGYDRIEKLLSGFPKREVMIRKINCVYIRLRAKNTLIDRNNGDLMLSKVFDALKLLLNQLNDQIELPLMDEEIDSAIYLLMFYAFTKCKLLQPPTKK